MVQMSEPDLVALRPWQLREPTQRLDHERMRDFGHLAPRYFAIGEERPVNQRIIDVTDTIFDPDVPPLPLVDIGNVQQPLSGSFDQVGERVGKLGSVRYEQRGDLDPGSQIDGLAWFDRLKDEVLALHQQFPRAVVGQVPAHALRGVDELTLRVVSRSAELCQPEVVAGVGMRQEDAVEQRRPPLGRGPDGSKLRRQIVLSAQVRRGVDQPSLPALGVDDEQAGDVPRAFRVGASRLAMAAWACQLRKPAVLGRPQDKHIWRARLFGRDKGQPDEETDDRRFDDVHDSSHAKDTRSALN